MKQFVGLAALILGLAVSAQAQHGSMAVPPGSSNTTGGPGGGGTGGAGLGGGGTAKHEPIPPTQFATAAASGSDADFVPSEFVTYENAIGEGQDALAKPKTVAEAAAENRNTPRAKAKLAFVQDGSGNAIIVVNGG